MNLPPREPRLLWPALWRLALAVATFSIVYTACNLYTANRQDTGLVMMAWERHIPFVPELIVPYWSLDLFFCGAFFLCRSKIELNLLTKRLVAVVLASGLCFLLFPLRMGLPRPDPSGWTAPLFHLLYLNDLPHNLAPSLHISLRSLIWVFYGAWLTGWIRTLTKIWFITIGASTLLLWQHHLMDVASGFLMGWIITALIPDPRQSSLRHPSRKLAIRYAAGAILCAIPAFYWLIFLWPAIALAIMALAYATGLARLLGKENGTLSPSAEWCLLPVILTARFIQRTWLRRQPPWHEITPGVLFGRKPTRAEAAALAAESALAVLDLTAESNAPTPFREKAHYQNLPLLDLLPPTPAEIAAALTFIRHHHPHRKVLIHCQLGLLRSATIAAHWLIETRAAPDLPTARAIIQRLEPKAIIA